MARDRDATAEMELRSWWGAGSAPHRPTVGTIPSVGATRSLGRGRFLPGLMVVAGAVVMYMSTQAWITADFVRHASTVSGTDQVVSSAFGVNGWATFSLGAVLVALSAVMMISDERGVRALAALVAAGTVAAGAYELIRVLQKIHYAHSASSRMGPLAYQLLGRAHIGYGLVVVAVASVVALLAALVEVSGE